MVGGARLRQPDGSSILFISYQKGSGR